MGTMLNIWIEHVDLEGCKHECKGVFECLGEYSRKQQIHWSLVNLNTMLYHTSTIIAIVRSKTH